MQKAGAFRDSITEKSRYRGSTVENIAEKQQLSETYMKSYAPYIRNISGKGLEQYDTDDAVMLCDLVPYLDVNPEDGCPVINTDIISMIQTVDL